MERGGFNVSLIVRRCPLPTLWKCNNVDEYPKTTNVFQIRRGQNRTQSHSPGSNKAKIHKYGSWSKQLNCFSDDMCCSSNRGWLSRSSTKKDSLNSYILWQPQKWVSQREWGAEWWGSLEGQVQQTRSLWLEEVMYFATLKGRTCNWHCNMAGGVLSGFKCWGSVYTNSDQWLKSNILCFGRVLRYLLPHGSLWGAAVCLSTIMFTVPVT